MLAITCYYNTGLKFTDVFILKLVNGSEIPVIVPFVLSCIYLGVLSWMGEKGLELVLGSGYHSDAIT